MTPKKSKPASDLRAKVTEAKAFAQASFAKAKTATVNANAVIKANAQVAVESGKILSAGIKQIGGANVADSRKAVTAVADNAQALAKVKSVSELLRLQGEQAARSVEALQAVAKRNSSALRTLFAGQLAPMVKDRVKANLELFRKAA